ncbi:MAG: DMT family transporter [Alistipes sp.]
MENGKLKGYICGAIAAASYGLSPLFTLPMYAAGLGVDSVLFYRYVLAVTMLAVLMLGQRQSFALRRCEVAPLVVMGLIFSMSSLTLFESFRLMDAGIAATLLFVYPVLVAIIMAVFFKERISLLTTFAILLALGGIALLYKGENGATLNLMGVVMVFVSALCYAIYIVGVNRSALREMATEKLTFYALLFGLSVFFVRLRFGADLQAIPTPALWVNALALGLLPTVISLVTMAIAIRHIGSTPTAILGALEPVTALFFGVVVFGEPFTSRIALGVVLILVAVTLIIAGRPLLDRLPTLFGIHRAR